MIREIQVKTILNHVKQPDPYFGLKYNLNLYRGCQHQCIYCDSRSTCYRIENFADIHIKTNAVELLDDTLPRKRVRGTIGTGSMNDPYMPLEKEVRLTRRALEVIARHHFPVHMITKSDLVTRDLDLLRDISRVYAAVSFTITTADDALSWRLEPGAPPSSARFAAMRTLSEAGILVGMTMQPILPFIEDTEENIIQLVDLAHENGARYILPWFGMSLRDGSRDYYYRKLDQLFPGVKEQYIRQYGRNYICNSPRWREMDEVFQKRVYRHRTAIEMPVFQPEKITHTSQQMELFQST